MKQHLDIVAALQIGFGVLGLLVGGLTFVILTAVGAATNEEEAFFVFLGIGMAVGLLLFLLSVPAIIGGIGLLRRKPWARILVLILSFIDLLNFPFGTAVGGYSIWVLMQQETTDLLGRGDRRT